MKSAKIFLSISAIQLTIICIVLNENLKVKSKRTCDRFKLGCSKFEFQATRPMRSFQKIHNKSYSIPLVQYTIICLEISFVVRTLLWTAPWTAADLPGFVPLIPSPQQSCLPQLVSLPSSRQKALAPAHHHLISFVSLRPFSCRLFFSFPQISLWCYWMILCTCWQLHSYHRPGLSVAQLRVARLLLLLLNCESELYPDNPEWNQSRHKREMYFFRLLSVCVLGHLIMCF